MITELNAIEKTSHPHITKVLDLSEDKENYYIVSELMQSGNLMSKVLELQKLPESVAAICIKQLLEALCVIQEQGIAHRGIKLENVMLGDCRDELTIKLSDFGFVSHFTPEE